MENKTDSKYHAFLLRLWRVEQGSRAYWRASLENPHTGEERSFARASEMFAFLASQMRDDFLFERRNQMVDNGTDTA